MASPSCQGTPGVRARADDAPRLRQRATGARRLRAATAAHAAPGRPQGAALGDVHPRPGRAEVRREGAVPGRPKIYTTLDLDYNDKMQQVLQDAKATIATQGATNAAQIAVNPRTGEILAFNGQPRLRRRVDRWPGQRADQRAAARLVDQAAGVRLVVHQGLGARRRRSTISRRAGAIPQRTSGARSTSTTSSMAAPRSAARSATRSTSRPSRRSTSSAPTSRSRWAPRWASPRGRPNPASTSG